MSEIIEGKFEYLKQGDGPPLILLHGLFGALSNFDPLVEKMKSKFTVYTLRLPIYSLPLISIGLKSLAKHLHGFIKFKGFAKVHLLGNSLGGHVGLVYATRHLDKIESLTLTGSSGLYENAFGGTFPRREDKNFLRERITTTFYDPNMVTDELVDECYNAVNDRGKLIRILHMAKSAIRQNMRGEIEKMDVPTCLIWGENDEITPPRVAKEFHEKMPLSELFWIPKCGHAPMMEHPETFNQIYWGWMVKQKFISS